MARTGNARHAPLPSPVELGFQPKFREWYPEQIEAIDRVVFNPKRFTALAMPTGAGKSPTGIACALLHPEVHRALYLTSTKGLQDQLSADFANLGLLDLRGSRNYPCIALDEGAIFARYRRGWGRTERGCDEGPCHAGVECPHAPDRRQPGVRPDCAYYGQVFDAKRAGLVSSNYAMYLASEAYAEGLGAFDLVVLDEAHDADKELESFLTLEVSLEECRFVGSKFPASARVEDWCHWADFQKGPLAGRLLELESHPIADIDGMQEVRRTKNLLTKLKRLSEVTPLDWIVDIQTGVLAKFSPLKVSRYAEEYLFRGVKHVVLMSATMTRKTTQLLGISPDDVQFWECPSRFPVEHRPVISVNTTPSVRVDMRMSDDDKFMWLRRIDRLIAPRRELGWKGIIHTVSYQRMRDLVASSEHKDIMIVHDSGGTKEAIAEFKHVKGPRLLVSPSLVTGYDFPDDDCRFQIIGKVPMPDSRGAIMKARNEFDKDYAGYLAMQKLVQACGRPVRNPWDWAETFIVDDHFLWFVKKFRKHAPRWFLDAVEYVDYLPEPLMVV